MLDKVAFILSIVYFAMNASLLVWETIITFGYQGRVCAGSYLTTEEYYS